MMVVTEAENLKLRSKLGFAEITEAEGFQGFRDNLGSAGLSRTPWEEDEKNRFSDGYPPHNGKGRVRRQGHRGKTNPA